jgi:alkylation response protein AidB-like acyl-CoA dehydrogenase
MDFDDTPEEAAFRVEARAWLSANAPPARTSADPGPFGARESPDDLAADVAAQRAWQARMFDGGWAGITWPKIHGGRGGGPTHQSIFAEEAARLGIPPGGIFTIGLGMVGPTLMRHGTDQQRARYLTPMLRGDEVWCQLFSEPGAGSDLAGLSTAAVLDGDEWVINGQKVWTSGAHYRDLGILLARSDRTRPKHEGITCFIVDMASKGIDVRPLRQMTGGASFNEVFLTDVRIPRDNVVGEVHGGWAVTRTTLMNERVALGGGGSGGGFDDLVSLARRQNSTNDLVVRQRLADAYIRSQLLHYLGLRIRTSISQGSVPGPEGSIAKLASSNLTQLIGDLALELQGPAGTLSNGDAIDGGRWQLHRLSAPSLRIAGGTDEVMRNTIGERVLGLPREPRVDIATPFREVVQ